MKKRVFSVMLALCMLLTLLPLSAVADGGVTWTSVSDWEELLAAWEDETAGDTVRLELAADILTESELPVLDGRTYLLRSPDSAARRTLYDVELCAYPLDDADAVGDDTPTAGTVIIDADVKASEETEEAPSIRGAVSRATVLEDVDDIEGGNALTVIRQSEGSLSVTVNGDVIGGLVALGNVTVTVNGDVTGRDSGEEAYSEGGAAVYAAADAQVTVNGNVTGGAASCEGGTAGDGVTVYLGATIIVKGGNISGGKATGVYGTGGNGVTANLAANITVSSSTVDGTPVGGKIIGGAVTGNYSSAGCGFFSAAATTPSVTATAVEIVGGKATGSYGIGGCGVCAENSGRTTVNANVKGGDAEGTIAVSGDAVEALDRASLTVTGDVTAGTARGGYVNGGAGAFANSGASLTVNGNATGGNTAGVCSFSGAGAVAEENATITVTGNVTGGSGSLSETELEDPDNYSDGGAGLEATENAAIAVGGNAVGGNAMGSYGAGGCGAYVGHDAGTTRRVTVKGNAIGGNVTADPTVPLGENEATAGDGILACPSGNITVLGDAVGGDSNVADGFAGRGIYIYMDGSGYDEDVPATVRMEGTAKGGKATGTNGTDGEALYFDLGESEMSEELRLQVQVWRLSEENGGIVAASEEGDTLIDRLMDQHTRYIIKITQPTHGELQADKLLAKEDETVAVVGNSEDGYSIKSVFNNRESVPLNASGEGSFIVKRGGGYLLSAVLGADPDDGAGGADGGTAPKVYYTVTATAGAGGSISPDGSISVLRGESKSFTVTPSAGYVIADVKVDGKSVGALQSYTLKNIEGDHTIEAVFEKSDIDSPQTGDDGRTAWWLALLVASAAAAVGLGLYGKKKRAV